MKKKLKPLFVRIDEELYEKIKLLVVKKFGRNYWGGLREVVEEALRIYIASHDPQVDVPQQLQNIRPNNPPPKVHRVYLEVRHILRTQFGVLKEATYSQLARAIALVRGTDKRTIRKWINLFLAYHCIKHIGGVVYELL